jgi:hypothetical protein
MHTADITTLHVIKENGTIVSTSKDKEMKFLFPPQSWRKSLMEQTKPDTP